MTLRPLSAELQKVAEKELNEVPDRVQDDLNLIREWLATKPHLRVRKDDQWLLSYLRSCKFKIDKVKSKLESYHDKKIDTPEFFNSRDPFLPEIQEVLKLGLIVILPKTTPAGPKIIIMRASRADPVLAPVTTFMKILTMILEIMYLEDDNAVVSGLCYFIDLENLSFKYITQLTPNRVRKITVCTLNAIPTRLKSAFFINGPSFFQIVFNLFRVFLPAKLKSRLQFCNDLDDINEVIPKSILPKEYGGEGRSCDEIAADWKLKIESYRDWFLEDASNKETPCETKNVQATEDIESNFGNLEID